MNNILSIIRADFNNGIYKEKLKFLPVILFAAVVTDNYIGSAVSYFTVAGNPKQVSYAECVMYIFRGMKEYVPADNSIFELPVVFVIINVYLAFLIGDYAVRDTTDYGRWMLIKTGSRLCWWISKCIWNAATVILFYISILLGVLAGWLINFRKITGIFELDDSVVRYTLQNNRVDSAGVMQFLAMLVFASVALSLFQMMLALISKPLTGFSVIVVIYVASGYYMSDFLLGNYMMLIRFGKMNMIAGVVLALGMCLVSVIGGYVSLRRRDLL